MASSPLPDPLPADPRRQAPEMLRAVRYQIWQSTLAWVDLGSDEALYLEGAEDFDVASVDGGEAVQVFDSTRNITLRYPKVVDAIANFWRLREASADRRPLLRFLSRAEPTVEQGEPFGAGVAGLSLWRRRRLADTEIELLSKFLVGLDDLPPELRDFLKSAPVSLQRDTFYERISWDLGQPDSTVVEKVVSDKLAVLGEPLV